MVSQLPQSLDWSPRRRTLAEAMAVKAKTARLDRTMLKEEE